jgi:hypothetical protein
MFIYVKSEMLILKQKYTDMGLFGNDKDTCPVEEEKRLWLEKAIKWLVNSVGEETIKSKKTLTPSQEDFPIKFNGDQSTLIKTSDIIAVQMDIAPTDIFFDVYTEGLKEINMGANRIFMNTGEDDKQTAGLYWGKKEDGKYHVAINEDNLTQPEKLIATIAHEFSHIKLLGEGRIKKNNEPLTDLTTVVYGLGIFNANAAFHFKRDINSWGYSKLGYLSQMDWGYALALVSYIRGEKSPKWIKFLDRTVKSDFLQGERFIEKNEEIIFKEE